MAGQIVMSGPALVAGLRADFADTYMISYEAAKARLADAMQFGIPSDKLEEIYGYYETAPYPRRWPRGEKISSKPMGSKQFRVINYDYGRRIEWHENDRQDDQTKTLFDQARSLGSHFATLGERIFYQIIQAVADPDLLPTIPNAPDGAALYSATDGASADRFGVSGGNIVSGYAVTSGATVRAGFYQGAERIRQFKDTEGQPLWPDDVVDQGYTLFFGVHQWLVYAEAFKQTLSAVGLPSDAGNAAVTNIVLENGLKVDLVPTQRITGDECYLFLKGSKKKAIFQQIRQPLREAYATMDTSDQVRDSKQEYIQWDVREGYSVALPYQTVRLNA